MVSLTDFPVSLNRHNPMGKGLARRLVLGAAVTALLAAAAPAAMAQQDGDSDSVLSSFKLEREAAEARDQARLAELVEDSDALSAALVVPHAGQV